MVGRFQSLILSGLIFWLTYFLAKNIAGKIAGKTSLLILSLAPGAALYYSSAVPHALAITVLLLALISVSQKKYLWSSAWFSLAFIIRENFLFTLIIYLGFLFWQLKISRKLFLNSAVIGLTLLVFFAPGLPGILKVLYNFPGVSFLLPIGQAQKMVLGLNWQQQNHDLNLYLKAILEFGVIYISLIIALLAALMSKNPKKTKIQPIWVLILIVTGFNLLAHFWGAFQLSPRAIVSYMAYMAPLLAVIGGTALSRGPKFWLNVFPALLILALFTNRYSSVAGHINQTTDLQKINQSVEPLKQITEGKNNIIWLSEPIALYLAGKVSYYPLINHTNFFKPSDDTDTVRSLGFWNQEIMSEWLDEAELVVMDINRLNFLRQNPLAQPTADMITKRLQTQFSPLKIEGNVWPTNLSFYLPLNSRAVLK